MKNIMVFTFALLCLISLALIYAVNKRGKKGAEWIRENKYLICILGIAGASFVWMVYFSEYKSLWYDDLYQISFSGQGQSAAQVFKNITTIDLQPPLFAYIAMAWLKIVPYGTAWVKLVSEIGIFISVILIGITGAKMYNKRTGVICSFFLATSSAAILEGGYSFRPYGYVILFTVILLYCYVNRLKNPCIKNYILLGVAMILLVYTHYLGAFSCFTLFLFDFFRVVRRKERIGGWTPYFIVGATFLPWLTVSFQRVSSKISTFWPSVPDITDIKSALDFMSGSQDVLYLLFLVGIVFLILGLVKSRITFFDQNEALFICAAGVCVLIAVLFFYSTIINPKGSVWVRRYFICVIPFFFLFISAILEKVGEKFSLLWHAKDRFVIYGLVVCTILLFSGIDSVNRIYNNVNKVYEPFKEAADILLKQEDIRDENVLVYSTTNVGKGWNYYLTKDGKLPEMNWADNTVLKSLDMSDFSTVYVFDVHERTKMPKENKKLLKDQYEKEVISKKYSLYRYTKKK